MHSVANYTSQPPYQTAAKAILQADYLLVLAGAGFSADSGLPCYDAIADLPPYKELNITYSDICSPDWIHKDPCLFFGFWGSCFELYSRTFPHSGYSVLRKWCEEIVGRRRLKKVVGRKNLTKKNDSVCIANISYQDSKENCTLLPRERAHSSQILAEPAQSELKAGERAALANYFVCTSNVDCFFRRSGFDESKILEVHGNIREWQCSKPCRESLLSSSPVWNLAPDKRFQVDEATMRAPPRKSTPDGRQIISMTLGGGVQVPGGRINHERCGHCGRLARPCILMFDDDDWIGEEMGGPTSLQRKKYTDWMETIRSSITPKRLVILEIGCGTRVPTLRNHANMIFQSGIAETKRIRINPDCPESPPRCTRTISIKDTCASALRKIDDAIHRLMKS